MSLQYYALEAAGIWLFIGTLLVAFARIKTKQLL
jgi:hypothetical protein